MKGLKFYCIGLAMIALVSVALAATTLKAPNKFVTEAAQANAAEIALSNLALQKSQNDAIRTFAQKMVTDHTAAGQQLMSLATSKGITAPSDMDAKHHEMINKLSAMSGADFDKAFAKQMVSDHEKAVALFQAEANSTSAADADFKSFAAQTLPTLQGHLQMARALNSNGGNSNMNMNGNSNMNMNSNSNSNKGKGGNSNMRNKNGNINR